MSFSQNPYRWFAFFSTSDEEDIYLYCSSCGGEIGPFSVAITAKGLMEEQRDHIMESHGRYPQDFASWSQPNHRDADPRQPEQPVDWSGKTGTDWATVIEPVEPAPEWVETVWLHVRGGDRVRIGEQEAEVTTSNNDVPGAGDFHAHVESKMMESGKYWDTISKWEHKEVRVRLAHLGETMLEFPPGQSIEVLMDRERQAIHLLQKVEK